VNSWVMLSGGMALENCKAPTRSGYGLIRERASGGTSKLLIVALAHRGSPGDSSVLEALVLGM
jgi:hypothetical protein